jgi:hypothetical protein
LNKLTINLIINTNVNRKSEYKEVELDILFILFSCVILDRNFEESNLNESIHKLFSTLLSVYNNENIEQKIEKLAIYYCNILRTTVITTNNDNQLDELENYYHCAVFFLTHLHGNDTKRTKCFVRMLALNCLYELLSKFSIEKFSTDSQNMVNLC